MRIGVIPNFNSIRFIDLRISRIFGDSVANDKRGPAPELIQYRESVIRMSGTGMSQRAIATALGISQASVNRLLRMTQEEAGDIVAVLQRRIQEHDERIAHTELPPQSVGARFQWRDPPRQVAIDECIAAFNEKYERQHAQDLPVCRAVPYAPGIL